MEEQLVSGYIDYFVIREKIGFCYAAVILATVPNVCVFFLRGRVVSQIGMETKWRHRRHVYFGGVRQNSRCSDGLTPLERELLFMCEEVGWGDHAWIQAKDRVHTYEVISSLSEGNEYPVVASSC